MSILLIDEPPINVIGISKIYLLWLSLDTAVQNRRRGAAILFLFQLMFISAVANQSFQLATD